MHTIFVNTIVQYRVRVDQTSDVAAKINTIVADSPVQPISNILKHQYGVL